MALAHDWPETETEDVDPGPVRVAVCRRSGCAAPAADGGLWAGQAQLRVMAGPPLQNPWPAGVSRLLGALGDRSDAWRARAACRGMAATMYPDYRRAPNDPRLRPALALCAACPVGECAAAGVTEREGVWGATTPGDRGFAGKRRPRPL